MHPFTVDSFRRTVMTTEPVGELDAGAGMDRGAAGLARSELQEQRRRWVPNYGWLWLQGEQPVTGPLIGGCLEVLTMALGTEIFPPAGRLRRRGAAPGGLGGEATDRARSATGCATSPRIGITERIGALLFSRPEDRSLRETLALYAAVRQELVDAGRPDLPFVANLDYGHSSPMGVLPLGRMR